MEVCVEDQPQLQALQHKPGQGQNDHTSRRYTYTLFRNVHLHLPPPVSRTLSGGKTFLTQGDFEYFHYNCDGLKDAGWGCAYRTLQSTCSWIIGRSSLSSISINPDVEDSALKRKVPTIQEIQEILVNTGDKPEQFVGSKDWIGALEVFYVIDSLYNVPCKILHVPQREDLKKYANVLKKYFQDFGGLVMMGGDMDASSKGIAGIHIIGNQAYFLVIDPHFVGKPKLIQELVDRGYIRWQHTSEFVDSSFYNFCLPQIV